MNEDICGSTKVDFETQEYRICYRPLNHPGACRHEPERDEGGEG